MASAPTSIRLTSAEKRKINAAARRRGLTPTAYIKKAALEGPGPSDDAKLARLEKLAAGLLEAVGDERDARTGDAAWERHLASGKPLLKPEEAWRELAYEITPEAVRQLRELGPSASAEIKSFLETRIKGAANPEQLGKPLRGSRHGLWRYRVRDWRILCRLEKSILIVVVVEVGHRSRIYED